MNKKSHSISLRLSRQDIGYLNDFKGKYSTSHAIRTLIRENSLKRLKTATGESKELSLEQQEREVSKWIESLT